MTDKPDRAGDHLANERTFLAWVRTSISIVVFGFVVAKFGITLRQFLHLAGQPAGESRISLLIGVAFMAMGIFMALTAVWRYRVTLHRLESGDFKPARGIIVVLGLTTALFGLILAVYLVFTSQSF